MKISLTSNERESIIMRDAFLVGIIAFHVVLLTLNVAMWMHLRRFLAHVPQINSASDLASYKSMVRGQMMATLVAFGLLAVPWLIWLVAHFVAGALGWLDLLFYVALPAVINIVAIVLMSGPANRAKRIETGRSEMQKEVAGVIETWTQRVLPDW